MINDVFINQIEDIAEIETIWAREWVYAYQHISSYLSLYPF